MKPIREWFQANQYPMKVWLASRSVVFLVSYIGVSLLPVSNKPGIWRGMKDNLFLDGMTRWDAGWYLSIANSGYSVVGNAAGQSNVAFFPLYPWSMALLKPLCGGNALLAGILISNVCFLFALVWLYQLVQLHHSEDIAISTVLLLAFFPFSFFFSAVYTESMFLMATVGAFLFAEKKRWYSAGLLAAAAGATRSIGFTVTIGIFWVYLTQIEFKYKKIRWDFLGIVIACSGTFGYLGFLSYHFGDPLLFMKAQNVEGWLGSFGWNNVQVTLSHILQWDRVLEGRYQLTHAFHLVIISVTGVLLVVYRKRFTLPYIFWTAILFLVSLKGWVGFGRYVMAIFPVFIAMAHFVSEQKLLSFWMNVSTALLATFTIVYSLFYWVA